MSEAFLFKSIYAWQRRRTVLFGSFLQFQRVLDCGSTPNLCVGDLIEFGLGMQQSGKVELSLATNENGDGACGGTGIIFHATPTLAEFTREEITSIWYVSGFSMLMKCINRGG